MIDTKDIVDNTKVNLEIIKKDADVRKEKLTKLLVGLAILSVCLLLTFVLFTRRETCGECGEVTSHISYRVYDRYDDPSERDYEYVCDNCKMMIDDMMGLVALADYAVEKYNPSAFRNVLITLEIIAFIIWAVYITLIRQEERVVVEVSAKPAGGSVRAEMPRTGYEYRAPETAESAAPAPEVKVLKTEAPKTEVPKTVVHRAEEPKTEAPKAEEPKTEPLGYSGTIKSTMRSSAASPAASEPKASTEEQKWLKKGGDL